MIATPDYVVRGAAKMADHGEFKEPTRVKHLIIAAVAFVGIALLPVVLRVISLFTGA
ncbi:hypothetical protein [Aliidiomarina sanyensis]|uniref:hypothetical protein n=1 Tax=Aliidiomarina sanyensis TaxID=1249555 RepID=UPI00130063D8|nr:hypothetical protein [Aliidiomarina sanyensis]